MSMLPNPFDPVASDAAAGQAVASTSPALCDATADLSEIDCIGEIFAGARKLGQIPGIFDPEEYTAADELLYVELKLRDDPRERDLPQIPDEMAFMEAIELPPLFLRQASGF